MIDAETLKRYRKSRRENPTLPAVHALAYARSVSHARDDWEELSRDRGFTREVDGFTVTLRAENESIFPQKNDGLGSYVQERRGDGYPYTWKGNYPEPESDGWPLGLPYTAFRYSGPGWVQGERGGYFVPDGVEEQYAELRKRGQSKSVAWDMTREWVESTLSSFFGAPLTYCTVVVTVSRHGVKLSSDAIGTSYIDDMDGHDYVFKCAEEHGMVDNAIEQANDMLAQLCECDKEVSA
jgi:hypothetical protein